jgi:hypothetical protein
MNAPYCVERMNAMFHWINPKNVPSVMLSQSQYRDYHRWMTGRINEGKKPHNSGYRKYKGVKITVGGGS